MAAKFDNYPSRGKRNTRNLMRELHLIVNTRGGDKALLDQDVWDEFEPVEPVQRTRFDLSD